MVSLFIPPLRERLGDIEPLVEYFIKRFNETHGKKVKGISKSALQLCYNYHWAGNVRQLENVLERSIILCQGDFIIPESLPDELKKVASQNQELEGLTLSAALAEAEKRILFKCLKQYNWNRQITAQILGISRTTLFNKMRQYQIDDPRKIHESLLQ